MNTQYRKNLKDVATACKNYTDKKIDDLKWELGSHTLDVESDTDVAFIKTVPSGTIGCHINKVGGMSYKYNQLVQNGNFNNSTGWSALNGTLSVSNNVLTNTSSGGTIATYAPITKPISHKVLVVFNAYASESISNLEVYCGEVLKKQISISITNAQYSFIATIGTNANSNFNFSVPNTSSGFTLNLSKVMCFDLTSMFGSGNEPTDVATATTELLKRGIDINEYNEYNAGTIRDSAVTSVVSKDSNNTTLDTYTIPAEVLALNGYGKIYSILDLNNKKFIPSIEHNLGNDTYYSGSSGIFSVVLNDKANNKNIFLTTSKYKEVADYSTMLNTDMSYYNGGGNNENIYFHDSDYNDTTTFKTSMNNVFVYYQPLNPIETDISAYLTTDSIEVEPNGTLTFNNTYEQAVPSDIDYLIEEVKS